MTNAFRALVETTESAAPVEVTITLDGETISLNAGNQTIGRWRSTDCSFQRQSRSSYRFDADGDVLALRVHDDSAFKTALRCLASQKAPLIPRWLAVTASTIVSAAVAAAAFGIGERPADATEAYVRGTVAAAQATTAPAAALTAAAPVASEAVSEDLGGVEWEAWSLLDRWNGAAPAQAGLGLSAPGTSKTGQGVQITVEDDRIGVVAVPTDDPDANLRIVAALGITVATAEPELSPAERRQLLESMGLRVDGANPHPVDSAFERNGVGYHLVVEPGVEVRFEAERAG